MYKYIDIFLPCMYDDYLLILPPSITYQYSYYYSWAGPGPRGRPSEWPGPRAPQRGPSAWGGAGP